jgi:hypothetical protein
MNGCLVVHEGQWRNEMLLKARGTAAATA